MNNLNFRRQQGATLIIALIFTVLLTVISLSSMHSSSFEIKVARSVKTQIDAFSSAEAALSSAEAFLMTLNGIDDFPTDDGFYQGQGLTDISNLYALLAKPSKAASTPEGSNGLYYIEYLGTPPSAGNSGNAGGSGLTDRYLFRVTGVGILPGGATKIIQSYFVTTN